MRKHPPRRTNRSASLGILSSTLSCSIGAICSLLICGCARSHGPEGEIDFYVEVYSFIDQLNAFLRSSVDCKAGNVQIRTAIKHYIYFFQASFFFTASVTKKCALNCTFFPHIHLYIHLLAPKMCYFEPTVWKSNFLLSATVIILDQSWLRGK